MELVDFTSLQGVKDKKIFSRFHRIIIYIYFALAFIESYTVGVLGPISRYYILFVIMMMFIPLRNMKFKKYHIFFIAWFGYKLLTLLWTPDFTIFKGHIFSHIGMMMIFLVFTSIEFDNKTISGIIKTIWISSGIMGLLSLFFNHPYEGLSNDRIVLFIFEQELDPNNQAAFLLIGIAISLYYLLNKNQKYFSIIILIINSYSLLLTGSRGGFVGFILMLLILLIVNFKNLTFKKSFKILTLSVVFFLALAAIINNFLPGNIYERIFSFEAYEGGSGRTEIWENALSLFKKGLNPLFGAGWGSYWGHNGYYRAIHNEYLAMLVNVGIFGFVLFFGPIFFVAYKNIKQKEYVSILILLSGLLPSIFLDSINKRFFWNPIILMFMIYNILSQYQKSD